MPKQISNDNPPPIWRDISQVTTQFPFSRMGLYRMIANGLIDSRIVSIKGERGSGKRLINITSLERYIVNSPTRSKSAIRRRKAKAGRMGAAAKWALAAAKRGKAAKR